MYDKSKLTAVVLAILAIVVLILSNVFKSDKQEDRDIYIVTNYSDFYTVNSCLYRTITYIGSQNKDDLLLVLSDNYKKTNSIKKDNVLDQFPKVEENSTFSSKKMYYEKVSNTLTKYYVFGVIKDQFIIDDEYLTKESGQPVYFIVYLDSENRLFSVEPYSGKIFKDGDDDE